MSREEQSPGAEGSASRATAFQHEMIRMRCFKEALISSPAFPQRLKPHCNRWAYGGTEVPPFQNEDLCRCSLEEFSLWMGFPIEAFRGVFIEENAH